MDDSLSLLTIILMGSVIIMLIVIIVLAKANYSMRKRVKNLREGLMEGPAQYEKIETSSLGMKISDFEDKLNETRK